VLTPELAQQIEANGGFRTPLATINGRPLSIKMAGRGLGASPEDDVELARRYFAPELEQQLMNSGHLPPPPDHSIHGVRPLSVKPKLEDADDEAAKLDRRIVITPEMQQQLAAEGKTAPFFPQIPEIGPNHVRPQVLRRREYDVEPKRRLTSSFGCHPPECVASPPPGYDASKTNLFADPNVFRRLLSFKPEPKPDDNEPKPDDKQRWEDLVKALKGIMPGMNQHDASPVRRLNPAMAVPEGEKPKPEPSPEDKKRFEALLKALKSIVPGMKQRDAARAPTVHDAVVRSPHPLS
jgi:hypothetical protein